jgi:hypothetical protein
MNLRLKRRFRRVAVKALRFPAPLVVVLPATLNAVEPLRPLLRNRGGA